VPVAAGSVAIDLDQRVGHVMDDKRHDLEIVKQLTNGLAAFGKTAFRAAIPDAIFGKQLRHFVGKTVGGTFPAAVVVVHIGGFELDDGFAVFEDLEALFKPRQSVFLRITHFLCSVVFGVADSVSAAVDFQGGGIAEGHLYR